MRQFKQFKSILKINKFNFVDINKGDNPLHPTKIVKSEDGPGSDLGANEELIKAVKEAGKKMDAREETMADRFGFNGGYKGDNLDIARERQGLKGGYDKTTLYSTGSMNANQSGGNPDFNIDGTALQKEKMKEHPVKSSEKVKQKSDSTDFFSTETKL